MMFKFVKRKMLAKKCLRIRNGTQVFFLKTTKINEINALPEEGEAEKYSVQNLPKNAFCFVDDAETNASLAIMTIGRKLYIMPAFFFNSCKEKLEKLGLKERQFDTPFSKGAIPYDWDWITQYQKEFMEAKDQFNQFLGFLGMCD